MKTDYERLMGTQCEELKDVPVGGQIMLLRQRAGTLLWEACIVKRATAMQGVYEVTRPDGTTSSLDTKWNVCRRTGAEALSVYSAMMDRPRDGRPIIMYTTPEKEETMKEEKKEADPAVNPANPKQRFGDMKRRVDLVPPALELGAAVGFAEGGDKYGPYNWRKTKVEAMTYAAAIKRHIFGFIDGEDVDPESKMGKLHIEGLASCIAILLDSWYGGFLIDNRPPKGPAPKLTRAPGFVEKDARYEVVGQTGKTMFRVMDKKPDDGSIFRIIADNLDEKVAQTICAALNAGNVDRVTS